MIYKNKDIETNINNKTVDIGNVGVRFYTKDENTGSIRIFIKWNGKSVDLDLINMRPKLNLFLSDGSIFVDEPINIISAKSGLIQYNIPNKVIKHAGTVNAKLFLESEIESVHVANFSFIIVDSGVEGKVQKEITVPLLQDAVQKLITDNSDSILGEGFKEEVEKNFINYAKNNPESFKGPQGEKGIQGEQGLKGERGEQGEQGDVGPKGDKGETGDIGPQGLQGPKGDTGIQGPKGDKGDKGNPFVYSDFTQSQLDSLKGPKGDNGVVINDTGWLDIVLQNGVTAYSSSTTPKYRIIKIGSVSYVYVKGTVKNFTAETTTIGGVPKEYADSGYPIIMNEATSTGSTSFIRNYISAYTGNFTVVFSGVPPTSANIKFYAHWTV